MTYFKVTGENDNNNEHPSFHCEYESAEYLIFLLEHTLFGELCVCVCVCWGVFLFFLLFFLHLYR